MSNDQENADAMGITLEEFQKMERLKEEIREAESRGLELWELRMIKSGASAAEIEVKRVERRRETAKNIGMTFEEHEAMNRRA